MGTRIVNRIEDIEGLREGDLVLVGTTNERQFFWSKANREIMPFCFGGILMLSEEERNRKKGVIERGYAFNVYGNLIDRSEDRFYEQGTPRYDYYKRFLDTPTSPTN